MVIRGGCPGGSCPGVVVLGGSRPGWLSGGGCPGVVVRGVVVLGGSRLGWSSGGGCPGGRCPDTYLCQYYYHPGFLRTAFFLN